MNRLQHKSHNQVLRKQRTRSNISGSAERPRLSVHISNQHITAQLVDDQQMRTLAYVTTIGQKQVNGNMTEVATWVGSEIGKKAKAAKVSRVVFDRGAKLYHGRIKALADAARAEGLEF